MRVSSLQAPWGFVTPTGASTTAPRDEPPTATVCRAASSGKCLRCTWLCPPMQGCRTDHQSVVCRASHVTKSSRFSAGQQALTCLAALRQISTEIAVVHDLIGPGLAMPRAGRARPLASLGDAMGLSKLLTYDGQAADSSLVSNSANQAASNPGQSKPASP